jgi:hypothetical protein
MTAGHGQPGPREVVFTRQDGRVQWLVATKMPH